MTLERRLILVSLLVSLPVAGIVAQGFDWVRAQDLTVAIERVVTAQVDVALRERCEADPTWFLTGLLEGRPRPTDPKPGPDDIPARPHLDPQPYQLFAYDLDYIATSPVGVRFPTNFRNAMRGGALWQAGPYDAPSGTGAQFAVRTGWDDGPCAILLGRMDASPYARWYWWLTFLVTELLCAAVFVGIGTPTVWRIRAVSNAAREAARSEWTIVAPATGHDELTAVGAALNEASADLRRRIKDIADREDVHRRFLARTATDIGQPLEAFAQDLAAGPVDRLLEIRQAHDLSRQLGNLLAAARLRMHLGKTALESVDLASVVARVVTREAGLARESGVVMTVTAPTGPVPITADPPLIEQALLNLVDNAVRYNRPGGRVVVSIGREADAFTLRVTDNGPGVLDDQLAEISAIRRFRGDEG
jgi:signal transduction histidine kinase